MHYSITGRPNCSLSPAASRRVFLVIALFTLAIAFAFFLMGAWLVLPFAGAELMALYFCLRYIWQHNEDYERLTVDDDKVVVEKHQPGHDEQIELNSYWAHVVIEQQADGSCRRLALRSHGKEIEFGRHLSSEERLNIGHLLKTHLGGYLS